MSRYVVVRDRESSDERLVEESAVPTEAALHEVLMRHPSLVPTTDLGFGRVVTVGFEASLPSGSADLVLLDDAGRVCIVEVKKEGNPDTRRVIAQLLDYAAALWGSTLEEFERNVLRRMLDESDQRGLRDFILEELLDQREEPADAVEAVLEGLAETLRSGDFALVLAAPRIPEGVGRVIEYLNARGHSVFGLEMSYFAGEVEAFVPRVVVRPSVASKIAGQETTDVQPVIEPDAYIAALPPIHQEPVSAFFAQVGPRGGELQSTKYGARVRVQGSRGPRVIMNFDSEYLWIVHRLPAGLDPETGVQAAEQMRGVPGASVGKETASLKWRASSPEQIQRGLTIGADMIRRLAPPGETVPK